MSNPAYNALVADLDHGDMVCLLESLDPDWIDHFPADQPEIGLEFYRDLVTPAAIKEALG